MPTNKLDTERLIGDSAKNQLTVNFVGAIFKAKGLIGPNLDGPKMVKGEAKKHSREK